MCWIIIQQRVKNIYSIILFKQNCFINHIKFYSVCLKNRVDITMFSIEMK